MVYYLKYRPQSLSDLIGQEQVVQTLQKALDGGRLAHAYLFVGPRGVGKTSTARILAKMVNCESQESRVKSQEKESGNLTLATGDFPCNNCAACLSINDGSCLDLIEIDAASNRGIDDIRELRDKIKLSPTSLKKKVYIIDEVHMLTTEAFNALLKTLEEPPAHVLFVLATTEVQKIPQTILSRVQRLDFKSADGESLEKALQKVAQSENLQIEPEALKLLVKRAEGSFRDGIKLLDQVSSLDKKITLELVESSIKGGKFETTLELVESLSKKDPQKSLSILSKVLSEGVNLKELVLSILDILRSLLFLSHNLDAPIKEEAGEEKYQQLKELSKKFSSEDLIKALESFQKAYEKMRFTTIPTLPLEIAVIESSATASQPSEKIIATVDTPKQTLPIKEYKVLIKDEDRKENIIEELPSQIEVKPQDDIRESTPDMLILKDKWNYILEMVKPYNFSLEAMLKSIKIDSCSEGQLILKVPYSFHQRILETPRNRDLLESVLADVLGKPIKVSCELDERPVRVEELANVELAADDEVIKIAAEIFNS